jgi:hypothetical protein
VIKSNKLNREGMYFNIIIRVIYEKSTANNIPKGEKLKDFSFKIRNKTRMPIFANLIQHSIGSSSSRN